ncbi:MAG: type III secretion system export apparatus subunit SctU [Ectothiorhodospiraceae bacterium]|nr:type III secretion system export apparatus subunit SctU [Ectothiorhodospiraceae bacterium]
MSERSTAQSKTEPPTPKRLRDAREKGQVARSQDIPACAVVTMAAVLFSLAGGVLVQGIADILSGAAGADLRSMNDPGVLFAHIRGIAWQLVLLTLPVAGILVVTSLIAVFLHVGPVFSLDPVKPRLSRISPVTGFKRIFSLNTLIQLLKLIVKLAVLAVVVWLVGRQALPELLRAYWIPAPGLLPLATHFFSILIWSAVLVFIVVAIFDLWFQRWNFLRQNRMTRTEVKRERKDTEGDPHIRGKRQQLHEEIATETMIENTKNATAVVVNPTHVAVALYYKAGESDLPIVVAKGEGQIAQAIRAVAEREGVPILQDVNLARRLQADSPLNQYIPDEFLEPVAAVLRWARAVREESER